MYSFFVLIFVLILSSSLIRKLKKYAVLNKLPGPSWLKMFSFFFYSKSNEDLYSNIIEISNVHGSVVNLWLKPLRPVLLVADPKFVEHILSSKDQVSKTAMYDLLSSIGGDGLATNKNVIGWKTDRRLLSSAFGPQTVLQYSLKFGKHADKVMKYLELNENNIVDIQQYMRTCTMDIILEYLCLESLNEDTSNQLRNAVDDFLKVFLERNYSVSKRIEGVFRMTKSYKTWVESIEKINKIFGDILDKQTLFRKSSPCMNHTTQLMNLLLESDLSNYSILSHLKTFILAGYETTASAISFGLFELAKRPDIQDRIYSEYLSIAGDDEAVILTYDNIQNLTYTEQVVKETLRMYPTVPLIQRRVKSPIMIGDLAIPDGVDIIFSIISLHNMQFRNPTKFDPGRFSSEKISPHAFIPFSFGPRDCIGRRLAMVEIKFILSFIVRHFTIHPIEPQHELDLIGEMSLRSRNGVPIIFKKRNG